MSVTTEQLTQLYLAYFGHAPETLVVNGDKIIIGESSRSGPTIMRELVFEHSPIHDVIYTTFPKSEKRADTQANWQSIRTHQQGQQQRAKQLYQQSKQRRR